MFNIEEIVNAYNDFGTVTIANSEREIIIEPAENYCGGQEGYFMKDTINIMYETVIEAIESAIEELGGIDKITDYWND